jgi:GNAT superfamily N-acetyltransferase
MRLLAGPSEGAIAVTVTSLEMTDATDRVPAPAPAGAEWVRIEEQRPDMSRDLYIAVGEPWHWVDRLDWPDSAWMSWVDRPEHHLLVCTREGALAGYAELEEQAGGSVEIAYFGLVPAALGQGLGRWWLSEVIGYAWQLPDTSRVWVHTCTLDGPAALATYRGRGMREFAREVEWRLPDSPAEESRPRLTP